MSKEQPVGSIHLNESLRYTGGAEGYILSLAEALEQRGVPVRLVTGRSEELVYPNISYFIPGVHKRIESSLVDKNVDLLRGIMDDNGIGVVHLHNVDSPLLYERLAEVAPVVRTVIDSRPVCPLELKVNNRGTICDVAISGDCINCSGGTLTEIDLEQKHETLNALASLDLLITPSRYTKEQLILNGISEQKIAVIPLFIPRELPSAVEQDENYSSDILFVGRVVGAKGVRNAIAMLAEMKSNYTLTICGDGPDVNACKQLAHYLNIEDRVKFVGWVKPEERAKYFANTKVVVFPSIGPESFGLVGLEAMHYHKPVVGFDSGGINTWLRNEQNGFLVPTGNNIQMANNTQELLEDHGKREIYGENGYVILNNEFTVDHHISALMGVYNGVTNSHNF